MQCGLEAVVSMPNFNIFEALEIGNEQTSIIKPEKGSQLC